MMGETRRESSGGPQRWDADSDSAGKLRLTSCDERNGQ